MNERLFILPVFMSRFMKTAVCFFLTALSGITNLHAAELSIGTASADITPKLPVALSGQFYVRIAQAARTPLLANVVVLDLHRGEQSIEQAIFVSCDLVSVPSILTEMVRSRVALQIPGIDATKIVLSAIHTHTGPVIESGDSVLESYLLRHGVSQPNDYQELFAKRVTEAIVKAWKARKPGSVTWGLTTAAVAQNRRAVYTDGSATMYGNTNLARFQNLEGYEDHDVNALFFFNKAGKLIATSIEVPCPAQVVENDTVVDADYWHPVRVSLKKHFGPDVLVMGWIGAAGDQSPHLMYRKKAVERMRTLGKLTEVDAIAKKIVDAIVESYETVKKDRHTDVILAHKVEMITLPMRIVTETEYKDSKTVVNETVAEMAKDPKAAENLSGKMLWYENVVKRYEMQKTNPRPTFDTEIHVIRLGDVAICTSQFELFTDFGIRIQARSKALQTFVVELAGAGTYLPTSKAIAGGGYSAICQSNLVGSEGGQVLADRTVELINSLWPETKK